MTKIIIFVSTLLWILCPLSYGFVSCQTYDSGTGGVQTYCDDPQERIHRANQYQGYEEDTAAGAVNSFTSGFMQGMNRTRTIIVKEEKQ